MWWWFYCIVGGERIKLCVSQSAPTLFVCVCVYVPYFLWCNKLLEAMEVCILVNFYLLIFLFVRLCLSIIIKCLFVTIKKESRKVASWVFFSLLFFKLSGNCRSTTILSIGGNWFHWLKVGEKKLVAGKPVNWVCYWG